MNFYKINNSLIIVICIILVSGCTLKKDKRCNIRPKREVIKYNKFSNPEHFATHYSQVFKNAFVGNSLTCSRNNSYRLFISDPSFKHDQPVSLNRVFGMDEKVVVLNKGVIFDKELEKIKSNKNNDVQLISDWHLSLIPPKKTIYYFDRSIKERTHGFSIKGDKYKVVAKLSDGGDIISDIYIEYLSR